MYCPALLIICFVNSFSDIEKTKIDTPGLPSGLNLESIIASTPASPQAITDVANPVNDLAASIAHFLNWLL